MREGFLPGGQIYYRTNAVEAGRKNLLFVHGLSGSSSAWAPFEEIFGAKYNLFSFDLRGHGKSWKPASYEDYEISRFAEDMHEVVEYLQIDQPILVSHSFATLIALEYIRMYGESVRAAILLSPSAKASAGILPKLLKPLLVIGRKLNLFKASTERGSHIDYKIHPQKSDWDLRAVLEDVRNTSMRVYLYCTEQAERPDYTSFLARIRVPVLLIQGREDSIFPVKNALNMAKAIPGAKVHIIEKADHIIVKNNVSEVAEAIDEFISNL